MNNKIIKVNGDFEVIKTNQKRNKTMNLTKKWTKIATDILVGRTITKVAYLTDKECDKDFGWYKRPVTFTLDDGKVVIAQMDDEGNDGGVLLVEFPGETVEFNGITCLKTEVLPVLSEGD